MLGNKVLSPADVDALADLPPRESLLAQLAGAFQAPMQQFAGLLQALPRNFAYGLKALIDKNGALPPPLTARRRDRRRPDRRRNHRTRSTEE